MIRKTLLVMCGLVCAEVATAAVELSPVSSVDEVLQAMDERGKDLKSLTADVSMTNVDPNSGDVGTTTTGRLYFEKKAEDGARFRILFEKKRVGKSIEDQKHDYVYADGKLTDRDYQRHQQSTHQILKPGEKMQIFKLDGPFPLPLGQDKDDVHKAFDVTRQTPAADDPKDTIHLKLLPHANTEVARKFESIDLWLDRKTDFPARVRTLNSTETEVKQTDLSNVAVNPPLKDHDFQMDDVDLRQGWNAKSE